MSIRRMAVIFRHYIIESGRLADLALHQTVEGGEIGAGAALGKEFRGAQRRELFRHRGRDELVDADPILLCQPFDLRLDRMRQARRVGALPFML